MVYASDTLTFAELAQVRPGPYLPEQSPGFTFQDLEHSKKLIQMVGTGYSFPELGSTILTGPNLWGQEFMIPAYPAHLTSLKHK